MKKDVDGNQTKPYQLRVRQPQQKMTTTPTTTEVLKGTQIQREGEYLLIKELGNMKSLVALGTARLVKFFIMHPATEMNDN